MNARPAKQATAPPVLPTVDSLSTIEDATCTACGCACDDIVLTVEHQRILDARRACTLGKQWFLASHDDAGPVCTIEGREATVEQGIDRAAELLATARYPLVYGLIETTSEAQARAAAIADWLGGVLDTPSSATSGPTATTFRAVGDVTCSLGEIRHRADLVIFWGTDPIVTHPRHLTRYSLTPRGDSLPGGRRDRACVVIDTQRTRTADTADLFLTIEPGRDFEALWTLRALVAGVTLDPQVVREQTGIALDVWRELAERMQAARYGALMFGAGLAPPRGGHVVADAVAALVRDLNAKTRFVSRRLREGGNPGGADNVLTWTTGYPFAIDLARGFPRFDPRTYSADAVLTRHETDAALVVACDPTRYLTAAARKSLAALPRVTVGSRATPLDDTAQVVFRTATPGIHTAGTVYRMDDVPLPLRPGIDSARPSDAAVLAALETRIRTRRG